jgi:GTP cyclohydrolase II
LRIPAIFRKARGRTPILADYFSSIKTSEKLPRGRPKITLSYAQSLDGSIALSRGIPYALSSFDSRVLTHQLRAAHDAILVGINTVVADDPCLTVRLSEGQSPIPIVLDSRLRLPLNSNLLKNKVPPLIATTTAASKEQQGRIEKCGAKVISTVPDARGWVDLNCLLARLSDLGINNVMVEGGARVITSFLSQRLVDWIVITIAPTFIGGLHALENPLISADGKGSNQGGLPEFKNSGYEQVGKDIVFWSALSWKDQ